MKLLREFLTAALAVQSTALVIGGQNMVVKKGSDGLQNIVSLSYFCYWEGMTICGFGSIHCWHRCFCCHDACSSHRPHSTRPPLSHRLECI